MTPTTPAPASIDWTSEYPEEVPDQLLWLETHLRVPRSRLLQLLGLPEAEALHRQHEPWSQLILGRERRAEDLEQMLLGFIAWFRDDLNEAVKFMQTLRGRIDRGELQLLYLLPDRPGVDRDDSLLWLVWEEPRYYPIALALFLGPRTTPSDSR